MTPALNYPLEISSCYRFKSYTGMTLASAQLAGLPIAPYDPTRPLQYWFDPEGVGGLYTVFEPQAQQTGYIAQIELTPAQAATLNIPGLYTFGTAAPPAPCEAQVGGGVTEDLSLTVCTQAQANAIAASLKSVIPGVTVVQVVEGYLSAAVWPPSDAEWPSPTSRRPFMLMNGTTPLGNAMQYIAAWQKLGVLADGFTPAPGKWIPNPMGGGGWAWQLTAQILSAPAGAPTYPVPIQLHPGDQIVPRTGIMPGSTGENAFEIVNAGGQEAVLLANLNAALAAYNAVAVVQLTLT